MCIRDSYLCMDANVEPSKSKVIARALQSNKVIDLAERFLGKRKEQEKEEEQSEGEESEEEDEKAAQRGESTSFIVPPTYRESGFFLRA